MPNKSLFFLLIFLLFGAVARAQHDTATYLLRPDRVFDGEKLHTDWVVLVHGRTIAAAGPGMKGDSSVRSEERRVGKECLE